MGRGIRRTFLFLILVLALLVRLRGVMNPLLDDQAWRQADTASMATHMLGHLTDIPDVFFPELNYDGVAPQRVELEFPFLPYLLASTWSILGWADIWGRLWAIGLSLMTVGGVYALGCRLFSDRAGLFAAAIYAFMPLATYYGRVVMPEPIAQVWSVWAFVFIWKWRDTPIPKGVGIAALFMAGAILAKLPQLMLLPVAILLGFWPFTKAHLGTLFRYMLIALLPPVVYYGWVHFGAGHSSQFVSGILTGQVVDAQTIAWKILKMHLREGLTFSVLVLSGAGMLRLVLTHSSIRVPFLVWGGISAFYIGVVCARIPLDYYLVPVLPLAALLSAYALDYLEDIPGTVGGILVLALLVLNTYIVLTPKYTWNPEYLSQAKWIQIHTPADSVLVLSDPPPMTFYYARRVGFRLIGTMGEERPSVMLKSIPGDYLVRLPQSGLQASFWKQIQVDYPEVGPGIFDLKAKNLMQGIKMRSTASDEK